MPRYKDSPEVRAAKKERKHRCTRGTNKIK